MKMESKLGDLVDKIRDFTGVGDQRKIYLYRINSRGYRSINRLNYVNEVRYEKEDLFRREKTSEVFFVRFRSQLDQLREAENEAGEHSGPDHEEIVAMMEPPTNLTEKGDPDYPIFIPVSHLETTQLIDFYAEKQRMLERKDM